MEKLFKLKQNGTTVRTELAAGLTTFMTMAYIIALNPNLLTGFDTGSPLWNGVFMATCIASALAMFCMAFLANKPFALAPGMGLNSFFAVVVANIVNLTGMSYLESFQSALIIILLEGIVFLILSFLNIREKIVDSIPLGIRLGIAPAIGLMLMNIGFGSNAGIYSDKGGPFYVMRDFFGALTPSVAQANMGHRLQQHDFKRCNHVHRPVRHRYLSEKGHQGRCADRHAGSLGHPLGRPGDLPAHQSLRIAEWRFLCSAGRRYGGNHPVQV